ncbi:MAG TPA: ADOP family duplicated permease [Gemmatimonadaceae bacterium]|nr:ADOP family duplicated permease [Gemmatimonadaceae bacterium]
MGFVDRLLRDARFAVRGFRRTPGFFTTTVAILGLGIGMSVAMFTVFRTVLIRRLPVVDQDRVVIMWTYRGDPNSDFATGTKDLSVVRAESRTMRDIAAVAHWPASPTPLRDNGTLIDLNRGMVTGNFFAVLGVRPALGRLLSASDDEPPSGTDSARTESLVLTWRAWHQAFGGDSSVLGKRLVDPYANVGYRIVGVAPPGFDYPVNVDYWIPMWSGWQSGVSAFAVGRLEPGASVAQAATEYLAVERRLEPQVGFAGAHAATFADTVLGDVRPALILLTTGVALLLVIACLNVGNLMLLRASSRSHELDVRRALGAAPADVIRQLVVEAMLLAIAGGTAGLAVAALLLAALGRFAPPNLPRLDEIQLASTPIIVAIIVSSIAVLLFGVGPALLAARRTATTLRADARSGRDTRRRRVVRQTLVALQLALATVMLGGAALLARSLERLERQDTGFVSAHLSVFDFAFNGYKFKDAATMLPPEGDAVVRRIREIPGVTAATQIIAPPLLGNGVWIFSFQTDDPSMTDTARFPSIPVEFGGSEYFQTFGIHIDRGRAFTDDDRATSELVAIVNEAAARKLWPGQNPLGRRLRVPSSYGIIGNDGWRTVVGVARDTHLRTLREVSPTVYLPSVQAYWQGYVAIRSTVPLGFLLPALRAAARDVDPSLELNGPRSMDEILDEPLAQPRVDTLLMSAFSAVALLLAAIGLFGVMASIVRDQTRELGIRIALGATPERVRRDVLMRAATIAGIGLAAGFAIALASSRFVTSLLFQVSPLDPLALGAACVVLCIVAAVAAYVPARRATTIDPVQALRSD